MFFPCPRCGTQLPQGAPFCTSCGLQMSQPGAPRPPGPPTRASEVPSSPGIPGPGQGPGSSHGGKEPARTMALDSAAALAMLQAQKAGTEVTLGRDPSCTIVMDTPVVSARHA